MRSLRFLPALLLALVLGPAVAHATPVQLISETLTFTASGSLNGTSFTNALVTITGSGDGSDIYVIGGGAVDRAFLDFTVTVAGVGSDTLTSFNAMTLNRSSSILGFVDVTANKTVLLISDNATLASLSLFDEFGPVTGTTTTSAGTTTSGGALVLTSVSNAKFYSGDVPQVAATPEPSSLMLLGTGVLGTAGMIRRKK